MKGVASCILW